ncbi:amidohydrolase, partial [Acidaminococcus timonensis]|uniref:M20 metallopeptidase family protein n=1 Tax=Acidaminococcus timonensis TaxID=1871002 RepID=UPI003080B53D
MDVKEQVNGIQEELVALRRHFHEHPERSWKEFETQKYIMEYLGKLGIPCVKACKSGVIATIKGPHSSDKIIGIRADIDALPITELGTEAYKSQNEGTMHACGHDTHITILLGTAKILAGMKDQLKVTVRLLFQPAEEFIEDSGAYYMKEEPLVKECDRLIALHIWSKIPAGCASLRYGPVMSAADTFDIYVEGKGGHGALPHQTIDPIVAGSEFEIG